MKNLPINSEILDFLRERKNLLAFSHGSDSTVLFHTLLGENIKFDCAFVNYKTRKQSDDEMASAKELCKKNGVEFYSLVSPLNLSNESDFESKARTVRYEFFDEICAKFEYNTLITAHQLNDKFEWFLMQLSKGSGLVNLLGFESIENRQNYAIVRPLHNISKAEILEFLTANKIKFFNDSSNENTKFKRNAIRSEFSDKFMQIYGSGVKKSMQFLSQDKANLLGEFVFSKGEFFVIQNSPNALNLIDKACKILDHVLSQNERKECEKVLYGNLSGIVVAHKICICKNEKFYFVAPFLKNTMDKKFREKCRVAKIPPLVRPYLYTHQNLLENFKF